ncbi:MAG: hypothetical protein PVG08_12925 [Desulfobacterales bacterium]|jgi:hypothetical protein
MKAESITLLGDEVTVKVDRNDFYEAMMAAIVDRVFQLLGPEFDKQAYLEEVETGRLATAAGQELAIPVSILLSLELGYCLGQLKMLGRTMDCDKVLKDLYEMWKRRLKKMLEGEKITKRTVH